MNTTKLMMIAAVCVTTTPLTLCAFDGVACAAEFAKYHRQITGRDAPDGMVKFAIDPKISRSGHDAYRIVSVGASVPLARGRAGCASLPVVTITGSNLRSVWYGLYDLLERRGGCRWFWDGDVVPKRDSIDLSNLDVHEEAHFE